MFSFTVDPPLCEDDEFSCDGRCIENERKCDGTPDCTDYSDEANCPIVNFHAKEIVGFLTVFF